MNKIISTPVIAKVSYKRILKDVRDLILNPLAKDGIFYIHDEDNMLKGYAMIIGPPDSLYEDGFFFFEINIPHNYPFAPPQILYNTQGDNIRFHPNLYRNGKVCLSILNTWKGEQWTSCQTLRSVLLTLVTLFHNKPLLNEPGITERHKDFIPYNKIIEYKTFDVAIQRILNQKNLPLKFISFFPFIKKHFFKKYNEIMKRLDKKIIEIPKKIKKSAYIYNMLDVLINYKDVKEKIEKTYITYNILDKKSIKKLK
jgi:ubiquitin-conjugating enzyme E2 Z